MFSRLKHALFILLQVLVVPAGQPLHRRQERYQMADGASRLAAHQLERIRILLLGHHAAARADWGFPRPGSAQRASADEAVNPPLQPHFNHKM